MIRVKIRELFAVLITGILIKVLYDVEVVQLLPKTYIYGLSYGIDFNQRKIFFGYIIFIIGSVISITLLQNYKNEIIVLVMKMLFFIYYIPITSAYYLNNTDTVFLVLVSVFWIMLCSLSRLHIDLNDGLVLKVSTKKCASLVSESKLDINSTLLIILSLIVDILTVSYAYRTNGLRISINLSDVYGIRETYVGSSSEFESVLYHFGGSIVIPISLIYALLKKNIPLFVIGVFSQLCIFSIAGEKGTFFIVPLVIAVYFISKIGIMDQIIRNIHLWYLVFLAIAFGEKITIGSAKIFNMFVRRIMYAPSWLNTLYYDFFSKNKLLLWSQDVFFVNRLGISRYNSSVLFLINEQYFGGHMPSPNTGLFAEAFMHWGYAGVVLYPAVIVLLLGFIIDALRIFSKEVQILIVILLSMNLTNLPITSGIFVVSYFPLVFYSRFVQKGRIE